jgi:hypothetical protein
MHFFSHFSELKTRMHLKLHVLFLTLRKPRKNYVPRQTSVRSKRVVNFKHSVLCLFLYFIMTYLYRSGARLKSEVIYIYIYIYNFWLSTYTHTKTQIGTARSLISYEQRKHVTVPARKKKLYFPSSKYPDRLCFHDLFHLYLPPVLFHRGKVTGP